MDRRSVLGLAVAGVAAGAAAPKPAVSGLIVRSKGTSGRSYGAALAALQAYMEAHRKAYNLPGLTLCVVDAEGFNAEIQTGWADVEARRPLRPEHVFQIGSISKSFTAICILKEIEAGRLSLDTDVRDILPEIPLPKGARITIGQLLEHSSGLSHDAPLFPRGGDGRLWLGFKPGAEWSYSNIGYLILGRILEQLEGRTFGEVVRAQILQPLGMTSAKPTIRSMDRPLYAVGYGPAVPDSPYPRGGRIAPGAWVDVTEAEGCIAATAGDMGKYVAWLIRCGRGDGAPVLSAASARLLTQGGMEAPGWDKDARYGAGLARVKADGRTLLHHTGGMVTFSSAMHIDPEEGVGCFASTNVGSTGYRPREITKYACALMRAVRHGAPLPKTPAVFAAMEKPEDYAGRFTSANGEVLDLRVVGGHLKAVVNGLPAEVQGGGGALLIVHPRYARFVLTVDRKDKQVTGYWWGSMQYARDPSGLSRAKIPPELAAMTGRYDNDNPWMGVARVSARPDGLYLNGADKLTPLGDGLYKVGEDSFSPERVSFDGYLNGRPQRITLSGVDFLRRDD